MEVSGHHPALATLHLGKEPPIPNEYDAGWAPQLVWWIFEKNHCP